MMTNDTTRLNRYESETVLKNTVETLEKGKDYARKLQTRLTNLGLDLDAEQQFCRSEGYENPVCNVIEIAEDASYSIRFYIEKLYALVRNAPSCDTRADPQSCEQSYYNRVILRQTSIRVCLEQDAIYIRIPMLRNIQNRLARGEKSRVIESSQSKVYREPLHYAISGCENFQEYDFDSFAWKTIQFLYVYHGLPTNKIYICDNDNHETKPVIDAIAHFLPLGDHPLSCEIHASATLSDEVEEGTYITITRLDEGMKTPKGILDFWKEKEKTAHVEQSPAV